jgi:glycosyltransferase involved in cell wall biosynthesis
MPIVSVIIPNYNHSKFLPQRIESLLNQTFQDFELILLDDCSPDNSREVLEHYRSNPKVSHIVFNTKNRGSKFKQWEKGIENATGEYIWIAESDDYCESTFLSELVPVLDKRSEVGIAYCQSISVDERNMALYNWLKHTDIFQPNIWQNNFCIQGSDAILNFFIYRNILPKASSAIFRKSAYLSSTGIDTNKTLNGDWLLWVKLLESYSLVFVAKEMNYFRQHSNKATGKNTKNFNNLKEIFELFAYIEKRLNLSNDRKDQMTNMMAQMWINQIRSTSLFEGIKYFAKVNKSALSFNNRFYRNFINLFSKLVINRIRGVKNIPEVDSVSISSVQVDFF